MTRGHLKERVAGNFSRRATIYDDHAKEQRVGALALAECISARADALVEGPVLEIGCGTGLLSTELAALFPARNLQLTDLSPAMIARCRAKIAAAGIVHRDIRYQVLDGEQLAPEGYYAMICTSFAVHWFADLTTGLQRLVRALKPGGQLLCAYPGAGSYREWHNQCALLGVPCSANALPEQRSIAASFAGEAVTLCQWQRDCVLHFSTAQDFLRHLKYTGANTPTRRGSAPLGPAQLRQLLRGWDQQAPAGVEVTCAIHFLAVARCG